MLSIIIPTLNEEKYLPQLLRSIKKQDFKDYEIIVADAGSKDKTREIAQSFGCQIVTGGLPAKGRNEGAKVAKGDLFLFLDADITVSDGFLAGSLDELQKRGLDIASFVLLPQESRFFRLLVNLFYNWPSILFQRVLSHAGMGILVKRSVFERVGGFDEEIKLAEDVYFSRQATKFANFGILGSAKIYFSLRRYRTDGYCQTIFKYFLCALYMLSGRPAKSAFFSYRFGHYSQNDIK